jgi:hypothetical protein
MLARTVLFVIVSLTVASPAWACGDFAGDTDLCIRAMQEEWADCRRVRAEQGQSDASCNENEATAIQWCKDECPAVRAQQGN